MVLDIDKLPASVIEDYCNNGDLEDVVFTKTPWLTWIQSNVIERKASGDTFKCNIRTGRNNNWQGYGPYQTWVFTPDRGYARAQYTRREHLITASLSEQEEEYNSGDMVMFDIVKETIDKASMSLMEKIEYVTISNDGSIPREAHGLALLCGDASSLNTEVGTIDCRDAPWWQSLIKRPGFTFPTIDWTDTSVPWTYGTDSNTTSNPYDSLDVTPWQALTLDMVDEMVDLMAQTVPGEEPGILLTTPDIKRALIRMMKAEGQIVLKDTTGTLVGGFDNVIYRNLRVISSIRCPRGSLYFLSKDSLKMRVMPSKWLTTRPWAMPYDQGAKYMAIYAWFQLYTTDRRSMGLMPLVSHR